MLSTNHQQSSNQFIEWQASFLHSWARPIMDFGHAREFYRITQLGEIGEYKHIRWNAIGRPTGCRDARTSIWFWWGSESAVKMRKYGMQRIVQDDDCVKRTRRSPHIPKMLMQQEIRYVRMGAADDLRCGELTQFAAAQPFPHPARGAAEHARLATR
jgi:hypothetical protein